MFVITFARSTLVYCHTPYWCAPAEKQQSLKKIMNNVFYSEYVRIILICALINFLSLCLNIIFQRTYKLTLYYTISLYLSSNCEMVCLSFLFDKLQKKNIMTDFWSILVSKGFYYYYYYY